MTLTAFDLAQRYVGIHELSAKGKDHPLVQWWLSLCGYGLEAADEVPWCSAFVNGIAWELRLPRSKSAAARSWLKVGMPVDTSDGIAGWDVVILKRGINQPGPEVTEGAPGHVGFYAGFEAGHDPRVLILGGNQSDGVSVASHRATDILGVRRLDE